jgi:serine/threonine-protein kinase
MGVVYRATDLRLRRAVALKVIAPDLSGNDDFRRRFERESQTAAMIRHPHVITIFHADEHDGLLYITMDYIAGTDLRQMISRKGPLEPRLAASIVSQVGSALDAAHRAGLVHRDVKPANVLVLMEGEGEAPTAYLTDFGLTKALASESGMTATGMVVGTVDYMAPEQVLGGTLDHRTDVYALGCVLYETLTGEVPYPRETPMAKLYAHTHVPPPSAVAHVPRLPLEMDLVIYKAMAKSREDRYGSAGALGRGAIAAAEGLSLAAASSEATKRADPPERVSTTSSVVSTADLPPAGWYSDPREATKERYWDGSVWSQLSRPLRQ